MFHIFKVIIVRQVESTRTNKSYKTLVGISISPILSEVVVRCRNKLDKAKFLEEH